MTMGEVAGLLTEAAKYGRRTIGEVGAEAWHRHPADVDYADAIQAMHNHCGHTGDWLMAAHVRRLVTASWRRRLAAAPTREPPRELADTEFGTTAIRWTGITDPASHHCTPVGLDLAAWDLFGRPPGHMERWATAVRVLAQSRGP